MSSYMIKNGEGNFAGNTSVTGLEKHIKLSSANFSIKRIDKKTII